jgi:hypothetical protein
MADEFFQAFSNEVGQPAAKAAAATTMAATPVVATADVPEGRFENSDQWKIWAVVFGLFIIAMLLAL